MEDVKKLIEDGLAEVKQSINTAAEANLSKEVKKVTEMVEQKFAALNQLPSDVKAEDITKAIADVKTLVADWADMERLVKEGRFTQNGHDGKTFREALPIAMKESADKLLAFQKGDLKSVKVELKDMTFGNAFPTADTSIANLKPGIIELPKRRLHIRELMQPGTMSKSTFDYVKEITGSGVAIGPVREGQLKNQFGLALQEVSTPAQWIAGFMVMSANLLDDVEGMTTFLQSRLPEKLLRAEDDQILNGNGVAPNLLGIQSTGNFTAASNITINRAESLVNAIAQLENLDREANGILLNPADWYTLWLYKGSTSGEYTLPVNLIERTPGGGMVIAGVPVFRSTAQEALSFLVGDWVMGANLITREPARVEFFREDGTNVRTNQITVRIEERVALPVYGNDYFIYGDFAPVS